MTLKPPTLDERLRAAVELVPPCEICADIGADHGRLSAALLAENVAKRTLTADVSAKALTKARQTLTRLKLTDRVTFAVADGLLALNELPERRADAICVLGMGGDTIASILHAGQPLLQGATLVLGAQTMQPLVRQTIAEVGYALTDERIVRAAGRMYLLMQAKPAQAPVAYTEEELLLGPCLLRTKPAEWLPWLERKRRILRETVAAMERARLAKDADRLTQARVELTYTERALQNRYRDRCTAPVFSLKGAVA